MRAIIGAGSNLGSRMAFLDAAAALLGPLERAPVYETEPVGPPQPSYLNTAFRLEVTHAPRELLDRLLGVEAALGRVRDVRWGPRTLDLDILHLDGCVVDSPRLTVPHPRLAERSFALAPLLDLAPDLAPAHGEALVECGGPPARFDPQTPNREAALADAINQHLPGGAAVEATRIEARTAADWVRRATDLPGACRVAIEPMGPHGVRGAVLRDGSERRLPGRLKQERSQDVVIAVPPKVG